MGSIMERFFAYLASRSTVRLLIEMVAMLIVVTWVGTVYMVTTNFDGFTKLVNAVAQKTEIVDVMAVGHMNKMIDAELKNLMDKTGADRAAISKFHDGKKDVQGMHFLYSSRTNEVLDNNVGSELTKTQSVPLSFFTPIMDKFSRNECVIHVNINPRSTPTYQWWKDMGNTSVVRCPIYDSNGNLTAFIGLDWVIDDFPKGKQEEVLKLTRESAARIAGILSVANKE